MADAMMQLYREPELRLRMATAARQRVRNDFHWSKKAEQMNELYRQLCDPVDTKNR